MLAAVFESYRSMIEDALMRGLAIVVTILAPFGFSPEEPPARDPEGVVLTSAAATDLPDRPATDAVARPAEEEPFSLYLAEAEIRDVLHLLGRHFNLNVITSAEVEGKISVYFTGVDPQAALGAIVNANGFAFRRNGNIIEVFRPAKEEEPDPSLLESKPVIRMIELVHADATELVETLGGLVPENANLTIQVESRRNALVIKGPTDEVESVVELARELDHPLPQIRIEVQILETVISDSKRYGIDWFARVAATGSRRPHTLPFDNTNIGGNFWPKNQTQGDDLTFSSSTGTTESSSLPLFPEGSAFPFTNVNDFIFGSLDASQLSAVLELIDAETDTRLVSRPEITTMNNHEAVITIGNEVPIPTYTRNDETNVTNISGFETQYIGTTLSVIPRVSAADRVLMKIKPEISDILEFRGEGIFQLPVTATRAAETTVTLEDGRTLVIGGLVRERTIKKVSKVPFLGDIPGLGYLFSYDGTDIEKSDLLIFITPHILGEERMRNTGKIEFEGKWLTEPQLAEVSALRRKFGEPDPAARIEAIGALDRVADEMVLEIVDPVRMLRRHAQRDPDGDVRVAAALALARRDPDALLETIHVMSHSKDPRSVRCLVAYALAEPAIHLRIAAVEIAANLDRYATIDLLNRAGLDGSRETAERAAVSLWLLGNGSDDAIVLFEAEAGDAYLQGAVLRALSTQGGKAAAARHWNDFARDSYPGRVLEWVAATPPSQRRDGAQLGPVLERRARESVTTEFVGSLYERKKLEEALEVLDARAVAFGHLVRRFLASVQVGRGETRMDPATGTLRLCREDLEEWHVFSLAHQLVRFATASLLHSLQRDLSRIDETVLACRTQYWAVHSMLGMEGDHRSDYRGFLDSVLARQSSAALYHAPTSKR